MSRRSKQDWDLWERVKRTTVPLNANRAGEEFSAMLDSDNPKPAATKPVVQNRPTRLVRPYSPEPQIRVSLASKPALLDEATSRRIARGKTSIDARIDLHGMTQDEAHNTLFHFLDRAYASGMRTVLVITGKGARGEGVLKQVVPRWLSEPLFRERVIGYRESHITHGGSGALYVRLRNKRREENR